MLYDELSDIEAAEIAARVHDRVVYDLGAGSCALARWLIPHARRVVAVDKAPMPIVPGIEQVETYFELWNEAPLELDICMLSWPATHVMPGLLSLLSRADTIIYRGVNDGITACGTPSLFGYLSGRPVLAHYECEALQRRRGCLTVYGPGFVLRDPTPEEARVVPLASWQESMAAW